MIEEFEDIMEDLANKVGAYGAHKEDLGDRCNCRSCFVVPMESRIREALETERKLAAKESSNDSV